MARRAPPPPPRTAPRVVKAKANRPLPPPLRGETPGGGEEGEEENGEEEAQVEGEEEEELRGWQEEERRFEMKEKGVLCEAPGDCFGEQENDDCEGDRRKEE